MRRTFEQLGRPNRATSVTVPGLGVVNLQDSDIAEAQAYGGEVGWGLIEGTGIADQFPQYQPGRIYPTFGQRIRHTNAITWDDLGRPSESCEVAVQNIGWVAVSAEDIALAQQSNGRVAWRLEEIGGIAERRYLYMLMAPVPV